MKQFLLTAINQHIYRGRHLLGTMPRPNDLPDQFYRLLQTSQKELKEIITELERLSKDVQSNSELDQQENLRRYRRAVALLNLLESTCVAAISRHGKNDVFLCLLVETISKEINYPILSPIVSSLSQQYFHIYPFLNLLFVPLEEGAFFLHLPDLYHELGHPMLASTERHNPHVKPFRDALNRTIIDVLDHLESERRSNSRSRGIKAKKLYIDLWEKSWVDWLVEFFCDLVAIYTLGPAFAWSHIYLCSKSNQSPYHVPTTSASSHPADHARMQVMLYGLQLIGYDSAASDIENRWKQLLNTSGAKITAEYTNCFPNTLLHTIASRAYEGVLESKLSIVSPDNTGMVANYLNEAWDIFWNQPSLYPQWETQTMKTIRNNIMSELN
ncbi:MAG: hypothetical protein AAF846_24830 [Chloroflexota bacterium]